MLISHILFIIVIVIELKQICAGPIRKPPDIIVKYRRRMGKKARRKFIVTCCGQPCPSFYTKRIEDVDDFGSTISTLKIPLSATRNNQSIMNNNEEDYDDDYGPTSGSSLLIDSEDSPFTGLTKILNTLSSYSFIRPEFTTPFVETSTTFLENPNKFSEFSNSFSEFSTSFPEFSNSFPEFSNSFSSEFTTFFPESPNSFSESSTLFLERLTTFSSAVTAEFSDVMPTTKSAMSEDEGDNEEEDKAARRWSNRNNINLRNQQSKTTFSHHISTKLKPNSQVAPKLYNYPMNKFRKQNNIKHTIKSNFATTFPHRISTNSKTIMMRKALPSNNITPFKLKTQQNNKPIGHTLRPNMKTSYSHRISTSPKPVAITKGSNLINIGGRIYKQVNMPNRLPISTAKSNVVNNNEIINKGERKLGVALHRVPTKSVVAQLQITKIVTKPVTTTIKNISVNLTTIKPKLLNVTVLSDNGKNKISNVSVVILKFTTKTTPKISSTTLTTTSAKTITSTKTITTEKTKLDPIVTTLPAIKVMNITLKKNIPATVKRLVFTTKKSIDKNQNKSLTVLIQESSKTTIKINLVDKEILNATLSLITEKSTMTTLETTTTSLYTTTVTESPAVESTETLKEITSTEAIATVNNNDKENEDEILNESTLSSIQSKDNTSTNITQDVESTTSSHIESTTEITSSLVITTDITANQDAASASITLYSSTSDNDATPANLEVENPSDNVTEESKVEKGEISNQEEEEK